MTPVSPIVSHRPAAPHSASFGEDRPYRAATTVAMAFSAAAALGLIAYVIHGEPAFSATPKSAVDPSLMSGVSQALAAQGQSGRRPVRLGLGGDLALPPPDARGLVISGRDAITSLASDSALADAAYMPQSGLRSLSAPVEEEATSDRVALLQLADVDARNALGAAAEPPYDADLAARLNISFLQGVDRMAMDNAEAEKKCMAEAIYFEARSEPLEGQVAVAEVVLNRVESRYWPNTICGVVNQGAERKTGCQFSYTCDGIPELVNNKASWAKAEAIADLMLRGAPRRFTGYATHYHADYVNPRWASSMETTTVIGRHIFYRRLLRFAKKPAAAE